MLNGFDGTLRVAEEEDEISYIDELFVRVSLATGETVTVRPTDRRLAHKDGRYVVLKKGESIEVKLAVPVGTRLGHARVVASGFFQPTTRARDR
jgi:hypothetical protein